MATATMAAIAFGVCLAVTGGLAHARYWDEEFYWRSAMFLTDDSLGIGQRIEGYSELTTPLAPLLFGVVARVFDLGLEHTRSVSMVAGVTTAFVVGQPPVDAPWRGLAAMAGLLLNPYTLFLSTLLYTDTIAAALVVSGMAAHLNGHHRLGAAGFTLAIAARQFMVVAPAAVLAFAWWKAVRHKPADGTLRSVLQEKSSWIWAAGSACSLGGWFLVFGGQTPPGAAAVREVPEVQQSVLDVDPESALYGLAVIGAYYVVIEMVVFPATGVLFDLRNRAVALVPISAGVLATMVIFGLPDVASGPMSAVLEIEWAGQAGAAVVAGLAVLAALRFSRGDLAGWIVIVHVVIMSKAHPWDRYGMPVIAILWLLAAREGQGANPHRTVRH